VLSGPHAKLTVGDNGVGMHEATLARIFDPFFTTHNQSSGLGLSVVTGLVRCHAGGISVYSKPDVGSSIEVYLPLVGEEVIENRDK
jgi:signal transduction histidine kinase